MISFTQPLKEVISQKTIYKISEILDLTYYKIQNILMYIIRNPMQI